MRVRSLVLSIAASSVITLPMQAQTSNSLRAAIETHYAAINSGDTPTVVGDHRPEMTVFFWDGRLLTTGADLEAASRQALEVDLGTAQVFINDFSAQIYGNVGVATFYLVGSYTVGGSVAGGTWRVTAVWIYENGTWKEAHHHESPLSTGIVG